MRLLFLINTLDGGGAEKVLIDLVNNLDRKKYDITVQTLINGGVFEKNLAPWVNYKPIISIRNKFLRHLFFYLISFILPPKLVYSLFIKSDYNLEIAYLQGAPTRIVAASSNKNAKKLAFIHNDFSVSYKLNKSYKDINHCYEEYKGFDKVLFVSENAKEGFTKTIGELPNSSILHNVLDDENVISMATKKINLPCSNGKFRFISVGRLVEQKGYDRLIEAVARLNKEGLEFEIWILGDGIDRKKLETLMLENNVNNILLFGFQENPYPFMKSCDMFICSSRNEGYSTVVTEAIILGLPILTTDCAGMNEILDDGNFGLIIENSIEGIYYGIKSILTEKYLYINYLQKAKERSSYFSLKKTISNYEELFDNV